MGRSYILNSCVPFCVPVKTVWGGYRPGNEYQLIVPTFVFGTKGAGRYNLSALGDPTIPISAAPKTMDEYAANPQKWPGIVAALPGGTRIRVSHFQLWHTLTNNSIY